MIYVFTNIHEEEELQKIDRSKVLRKSERIALIG